MRGLLLTGMVPRFLRAEGSPSLSLVDTEPLWWPPAKIVGRYLAPFLADHLGLSELLPDAARESAVPVEIEFRTGRARRLVGDLGGGLFGRLRQVPVDQRVPELPLRAGQLEPVPLERGLARAAVAQLLALRDERGDPERQGLDARIGTTPSETGRPQLPQ